MQELQYGKHILVLLLISINVCYLHGGPAALLYGKSKSDCHGNERGKKPEHVQCRDLEFRSGPVTFCSNNVNNRMALAAGA